MPNETIIPIEQLEQQSDVHPFNYRTWTKFGLLALGLPSAYLLAKTTGVFSWVSSFVTGDGKTDALVTTDEGQLSTLAQQPLEETEGITKTYLLAVRKEIRSDSKFVEFEELPFEKRNSLQIPIDGLIARYPFDGNTQDTSGNEYHGIGYEVTPVLNRFGIPNSAYSFNGVDSRIKLNGTVLDGLNAFSVSLFIKSTPGDFGGFLSAANTAVSREVLLYQFGSVRASIKYNSYEYDYCITVNLDNKWHHLVFCRVDDIGALYVDGNLIGTYSSFTPGSLIVDPNGLWLGIKQNCVGGCWTYQYDGDMDDVYFYNRTLTPEEVQALYHEGGWDLSSVPTSSVISSIIPSPTTSAVPSTPISSIVPSPTVSGSTPTVTTPSQTPTSPSGIPSPTYIPSSSANPTTNPSSVPTQSSVVTSTVRSSSSQVSTIEPPVSSSNIQITTTSSTRTPANNRGVIVGGAAGSGAFFILCIAGTLVGINIIKKRNGNRHDAIVLSDVEDVAVPVEAKAGEGSGNGSGNGSRAFIYVGMNGGSEYVQVKQIQEKEVEIEEKIGTGSFGTVSKAKWSGSIVAVKALHPHLLEDPQTVASFKKEAAILSGLRHENIVGLYGMFETKSSLGIVMQLASFGSLNVVLEDQGQRFTFKDCLQIGMGMMNGLNYLHENEIWHRDLKPGNILVHEVSDRLTALITDLGDAKVFSADQKQMTKGVGTVCWTSPEILQGGTYTGKADVYSCGIIFCQFVTRRTDPYEYLTNQFEIVSNVQNGGRPEIPKHCDAGFARLIQCFWAQDPAERPEMNVARDAFREYKESYTPM